MLLYGELGVMELSADLSRREMISAWKKRVLSEESRTG